MQLSLADLPHELLSQITSYLPRRDDKSDLQNLCLVSRGLHKAARYWLFQHVTVLLDGANDEERGMTADKLFHLTELPLKITSIAFRTRAHRYGGIFHICEPDLQFFLNSSSVALKDITFEFHYVTWTFPILDSLKGVTSDVTRIRLDDCCTHAVDSFWLRQLVSRCSSRLCIEYEYLNYIHREHRQHTYCSVGVDTLPGYALLGNLGTTVKHLQFGCDVTPDSIVGVLPFSFLSNLESLTLDPGVVDVFAEIFETIVNKEGILLQRFFLTADSLDDFFFIEANDYDPRERIPALISCCPRIQVVDFHTSFFFNATGTTFCFTDFPSTLRTFSVSIRDDSRGGPNRIEECLSNLYVWISKCTRLETCRIELRINWEAQGELLFRSHDGSEFYEDEEDEEEAKLSRLRYPWDPASEPESSDAIQIRFCSLYLRDHMESCVGYVAAARRNLQRKAVIAAITSLDGIDQVDGLVRPVRDRYPKWKQLSIKPYLVPTPREHNSGRN